MEIEALILDMRKEQREDHATVITQMAAGFKSVTETMQSHEKVDLQSFASIDKRVSVVEGTRKALIWLVCAVIVASLAAGADAYFNHRLFKEDANATELPHPSEAGVHRR